MRLRHRPQWPVLVTCYLILVTSRAKRARMVPKTGLVELRSSPTDSILSDCPISVSLERDFVKPAQLVLVPSSATPSERLSYDPWLSFESEGWCPRLDSNQHTLRHGLLRPACLPIPPPGQLGRNEEHTEPTRCWQAPISAFGWLRPRIGRGQPVLLAYRIISDGRDLTGDSRLQ
jgi:hypothetical protein